MEKSSATTTCDVEAHHQQQHGGGLPSPDDAGNVDEPPIPSAGSSIASVLLKNEKDADGARTQNSSIISVDTIIDGSDIHHHAHTLSANSVAGLLGSNIQYVCLTDDAAPRLTLL